MLRRSGDRSPSPLSRASCGTPDPPLLRAIPLVLRHDAEIHLPPGKTTMTLRPICNSNGCSPRGVTGHAADFRIGLGPPRIGNTGIDVESDLRISMPSGLFTSTPRPPPPSSATSDIRTKRTALIRPVGRACNRAPWTQCGHHCPLGLQNSGMVRSLQQSVQVPQRLFFGVTADVMSIHSARETILSMSLHVFQIQNRRKASIGREPEDHRAGCGDDSPGAGILAKNVCGVFAACDIDRCRQPVGDHRAGRGDGYGGHLGGRQPGARIENMTIAPVSSKTYRSRPIRRGRHPQGLLLFRIEPDPSGRAGLMCYGFRH